MEPTRSAITKHCSRLSGLRCAAPPIRVPDRSRCGSAAEGFPNVAALQTPMEQLITLRLWIAPPVTAHHPVAPSSLSPTTHGGVLVSGEAWSFTGRQTPLRIGHPGLVFRPPRQNSPRPQARAPASAASPLKPRLVRGFVVLGVRICSTTPKTQDVVFDRRHIRRVKHARSRVKGLVRPAARSAKPRPLDDA